MDPDVRGDPADFSADPFQEIDTTPARRHIGKLDIVLTAAGSLLQLLAQLQQLRVKRSCRTY